MKKLIAFYTLSFSFFYLWMFTGYPQELNTHPISILYTTTVFQSGMDDYEFYRIPALLKEGSRLYAFSEGRKNDVSDNGQIDIVMKISTDFGKSWGPLIQVTDMNGQSCQNPTPVYIHHEKKILLLFTKRTVATDTEGAIRNGTSEGYVGAYTTSSQDHGITWSPVKEITDQVKLKSWRWYAFGPGGAIVLQKEDENQGRIVIPANHSIDGGSGNEYLGSHAIFSDDHGKSWQIGAVDSQGMGSVNPNELTVIETSRGTLYFNARNQNNQPDSLGNRAITYSRDGGLTFVRKFFHEPQMITPVVHASLTRLKDRILFLAPSNLQERKNFAVWISDDETLTWSSPYLIQEGWAAYSSSVNLKGNEAGILFETGDDNPYQEINFMEIRVE